MDNILNYPTSCIVDNVVPKTMFYRFMEVSPRMKKHFVNDVESITWLYKLSASSLNVADSPEMKEVEVFVAKLKSADCPKDLFTFIDENMPHHIIFILTVDDNYMILQNYKEWADETHTKFKISKSFSSLWVPQSELSLPIDGLSLPRIYDNFAASLSGIGQHKAGELAEIIKLKTQISAKEKELKALQAKVRSEKQFNLQMEMNRKVKAMRKELDDIKNQLEKLQ